MGLRVRDRGGSEGRSVMGRIGVATSPHPKGGRLPRGVGGREPSANRRRGHSRTVGAVVTAAAGAASATEVTSVAGTAAVTPRWSPKTNGATASRKGCRRTAEAYRVVSRRDVVRGLSCMQGNLPVQFLGGGRPAMASRYPTHGGLCPTCIGGPYGETEESEGRVGRSAG